MLRSVSGTCPFSPYEFWDVLSKLVPVGEILSASVFSMCAFCAMALSFIFLLYILKYTAICFEEKLCVLQRIAAPYHGLLKHSSCRFAHFSLFNVVVKHKNALFFTLLSFLLLFIRQQVLSNFLVLFVFRRPCVTRTFRVV